MIALAILTGAVIAATIFAAAWIRTGRGLDNTINEVNAGIDVDRAMVCQIGKCGRPAVSIYDRHPSGFLFICSEHSAAVRGWAGPYGRDVSGPGWVDGGKR